MPKKGLRNSFKTLQTKKSKHFPITIFYSSADDPLYILNKEREAALAIKEKEAAEQKEVKMDDSNEHKSVIEEQPAPKPIQDKEKEKEKLRKIMFDNTNRLNEGFIDDSAIGLKPQK